MSGLVDWKAVVTVQICPVHNTPIRVSYNPQRSITVNVVPLKVDGSEQCVECFEMRRHGLRLSFLDLLPAQTMASTLAEGLEAEGLLR